MNSPALTNAVPAKPVVTNGARILADVVRNAGTVFRFPSNCGGARVGVF